MTKEQQFRISDLVTWTDGTVIRDTNDGSQVAVFGLVCDSNHIKDLDKYEYLVKWFDESGIPITPGSGWQVEENLKLAKDKARLIVMPRFSREQIAEAFSPENIKGAGYVDTNGGIPDISQRDSSGAGTVEIDACLDLRQLKMLVYLMERHSDYPGI